MNKANDNVSGLATNAFWPAVHFCISRDLYSPIKHILFHSLILFRGESRDSFDGGSQVWGNIFNNRWNQL